MATEGEDLVEGIEVRETGAGKFQVQVRTSGGAFLADEPVVVGGLGSGPTPYDLLSSALGACTAMTVRLYAARKGWPLTQVTVRVLHRAGGTGSRDRFAREIVLEGPLAPEQRRRLLEIAERCSVHRTLAGGAEIVSVLADPPLAGTLDPEPPAHAEAMVKVCED